MPTLDGATVYLISQYEARVLPEYAPGRPADPFVEEVKLYDEESRVVNVYVPVYRSSQFWIAYHCFPSDDEPDVKFLYYKLFINGRHVVSWGCGADEQFGGKTMFSIHRGWRNNHKGNLTPFDEHRTFVWGRAEEEDELEPRKDVIEVQLFRARARKRIDMQLNELAKSPVADLDAHAKRKDPSPSVRLWNAGSLMYGQPKRFFKYALMDPVDTPFTTFRYLYRTLPQLEKLGVISLEELERQQAEADATEIPNAHGTPKKLGPRIIPSVSLRSILSIASETEIQRSPFLSKPGDLQKSPSPLRVPTTLSVTTQQLAQSNVSVDDLSAQARDSLDSNENEAAIRDKPPTGRPSIYINKNSPLIADDKVDRFSRSLPDKEDGDNIPHLGAVPRLRPSGSKEQMLRECVSTLLGELPVCRPQTPEPRSSPPPQPRRNRLFGRSSGESLRSEESPTRPRRSASSTSTESASSGVSHPAGAWISDWFGRAKTKGEERKQEGQGPGPTKLQKTANTTHSDSMATLNDVLSSARKRRRPEITEQKAE